MPCMHTNVLLGRDSLYCCDCLGKVKDARFLLQTQAQYERMLGRFTPPAGPAQQESADRWWAAQDADPAWAREWEGDTDRTDPRAYK